MNSQFEKIKDSVLELYRDVTGKKCAYGYQDTKPCQTNTPIGAAALDV